MLEVEKPDTVDVKSKILRRWAFQRICNNYGIHACHCKTTKYCRTRVLVTEARCGLGMDMGMENEPKPWNPITLGRLLNRSMQPLV